jgi:2-oxoglutarate dehydrogenase E2 component (dihydrolipoamide succinyltransferase)
VIEVCVPVLPESIADATLVTWHKQPGAVVARDENLADLETDKVVLEVPAPVSGILRELRTAAGSTVKSRDVLALIDVGPDVAAPSSAVGSRRSGNPSAVPMPTKAAPAVRRMKVEEQANVGADTSSGVAGRVTKQDVCRSLRANAPSKGRAPSLAKPVPESSRVAPRGSRAERRVPMTRLHAQIAARLIEAQGTQALLTTFNEVDMAALSAICNRHEATFERNYGARLGFMSFFVKAALQALRKFSIINAYVDGSEVIYHDYFDIGVAVSTDRGLLVHVLRDADMMGSLEIERALAGFAQRARDGAIRLEELTGGTFAITNGGVFGSLLSTPVVNSPQSAMLGLHKIQDRPVVVDGVVVVRPMMYLALTYDHRIIDGREAVQFLVAIKDAIEDPARLILEI